MWSRSQECNPALFISKKTVSVHVSNVLRKLRVSNRIEAGKIGQRHGLLPAGLEVSR
jgi:DNA-binding NarL/FixJ family response regulator